MSNLCRCVLYISLLLTALPAHAESKVAGVELADNYRIGEHILQLNGAGIRSKLFVKVYVGALYLSESSNSAAAILAAPGAKSMQMTMLYKKVDADKITQGWSDGFEANLSESELMTLKDRLQTFNALFPTLHQGDIVRMDYAPDVGTQLSINGKQLGTIEGADFATALLRVWIGEHPADKKLRKGLLGN